MSAIALVGSITLPIRRGGVRVAGQRHAQRRRRRAYDGRLERTACLEYYGHRGRRRPAT